MGIDWWAQTIAIAAVMSWGLRGLGALKGDDLAGPLWYSIVLTAVAAILWAAV